MTTTTTMPILPVEQNEAERAVATLTMAFSADPILRWVFPDSREFLEGYPQLVRAFGANALQSGTVERTPAFEGVALWLAPASGPDEALLGALIESFPDERKEELLGFLGKMEQFHIQEPHWYLPFIGVDPARQGSGHGSALLAHATARCDRDGLPAYLEASSPRNKPLYERHGFVEAGVIQYGSSPAMWSMVRKPR